MATNTNAHNRVNCQYPFGCFRFPHANATPSKAVSSRGPQPFGCNTRATDGDHAGGRCALAPVPVGETTFPAARKELPACRTCVVRTACPGAQIYPGTIPA